MQRIGVLYCVLLAVPALRLAAAASETGGARLVRYDLSLEVDTEACRLKGSALMEIEALRQPLKEIRLSLNARLQVTGVDANTGSVTLREGGRIAEGRARQIEFEPPLAAGKRVQLTLSYEGEAMDPDASGPDWMGILLVREDEVRMAHQSQWYPVLPKDDSGLAKQAAPVQLALTLPAKMESLGPGTFRGKKRARKGREVHLWASDQPVQASILAGRLDAFTVKKGKREVRVLAQKNHARGARRWAEEALQVLGFLEEELGRHPQPSYGIGEMRVLNRTKSYNYEADGFSVFDAVLFDGRDPQPAKIAHEVAHRWWGGGVDAVGRGERFLTESLAEATAYLYVEAKHDRDVLRAAVERSIAAYHRQPGDEKAVADSGFGSPRFYAVIYAKGAMALRTLRFWIGEESWLEGMQAFWEQYGEAEESPDLEAFLEVLSQSGGEAVTPWAEDWLLRPGVPDYRVEYSMDRGSRRVRGLLLQEGDYYRNPIELSLQLSGGKSKTVTIHPDSKQHSFELAVPAAVQSIELDPRLWILRAR
jgi:hypothetical protein